MEDNGKRSEEERGIDADLHLFLVSAEELLDQRRDEGSECSAPPPPLASRIDFPGGNTGVLTRSMPRQPRAVMEEQGIVREEKGGSKTECFHSTSCKAGGGGKEVKIELIATTRQRICTWYKREGQGRIEE